MNRATGAASARATDLLLSKRLCSQTCNCDQARLAETSLDQARVEIAELRAELRKLTELPRMLGGWK